MLSSNTRFKVETTSALAVTIAAALAGPTATAVFCLVSATLVIAYFAGKRLDALRIAVVVVQFAVATSALFGPVAYVGLAVNGAGIAFLTWFAWCFRIRRLF